MFHLFKKTEVDALEVIIGPHSTFNGVLRSDTSIRIDGAVEGGFVETAANVILTETSYVQCDIVAKAVSIRGTYNGTINANRVELLEGSQVYGLIQVDSFFMDEGAMLNADLIVQGVRQNTRPMMGSGYEQPRLEQELFENEQLALPQFSLDELSTRLPVDTSLNDLLYSDHYINGANELHSANGVNGANGLHSTNGVNGANGLHSTNGVNGTADAYRNLSSASRPLPPTMPESTNGQTPIHPPTQMQTSQPISQPISQPVSQPVSQQPSQPVSQQPSQQPLRPAQSFASSNHPQQNGLQNGPPSSIPVVSPFPTGGPPRAPAYQPVSLSDLENKTNHSNNTKSNK